MLENIKAKFKKTKDEPKTKKKPMSAKDYEDLGRAVERVYYGGFASKGRLMYMSLLRGIGYGVGIFIGGTIVVAIVLSLLVRFENVPLLGEFAQKINQAIESSQEADLEEVRQNVEKRQQSQQDQ